MPCVAYISDKMDTDSRAFTLDWSPILTYPEPIGLPDRIAQSSWEFDAASPATGSVSHDGFSAERAVSWCCVSGGSNGDVFHLNNTITTAGVQCGGVSMPPQTFVRQVRIRVRSTC
jgi:hypothetical protein